MRKRIGWLVMLAVVAGATGLWAQEKVEEKKKAEKKEDVTVRPVGVQVSGGPDVTNENYQMRPFNTSGMAVAILVESRNKTIVEVDREKSKLTSLTDNKGTNLLPFSESARRYGTSSTYPRMSKDGKSVMLQLHGGTVPAKGATSVKAEGVIYLTLASKQAKSRQKDVPLQLDAQVTVGPVPLTITGLSRPSHDQKGIHITFTADQSLAAIKAIRFFDAEGKEVTSRSSGSSNYTSGGRKIVQRTYSLSRKPDKMDVEIEHWQDVEQRELHYSVTVGLGL